MEKIDLTFRENFFRFSFRCFWFIFCRFTPRFLSFWRVFVLRLFGARIGKNCIVYGSANIWAPWNLIIGDDSCLGPNVFVYNVSEVCLGSRVIVSQGTELCTPSHNFRSVDFHLLSAPIVIGNDCWLASSCFVGGGVHFEDNVVLGARSVVRLRGSLAAGVYAGNPIVCVGKTECIRYSF